MYILKKQGCVCLQAKTRTIKTTNDDYNDEEKGNVSLVCTLGSRHYVVM